MMIQNIKTFLLKPIPNIGLELFRILYNSVLFFEILHFFKYRHLIFDEVPYVSYEIGFGLPLMIWAATVGCIIMGFQTKLASIINYVLTITFFSAIEDFEYHMQYAYLGLNFIQILTPLGKRLSIDRLQSVMPVSVVPRLYYLIPIFFGLAVVYFDSVFFKLSSPMWRSGLGMWLPASLPVNVNIDLSFILNNELLIKTLGYTTFVFETIFILTFWMKRLRIPLLVVGAGLHLGIFVAFPIPLFALGAVSLYVLMVPLKFWNYFPLFKFLEANKNWYVPYDFSINKRVLSGILILLIFFQVASTSRSLINSGFIESRLVDSFTKMTTKPSKKLFGITPHAVFMDYYFEGYNHIIGIQESSTKSWIPVTDEKGLPGKYLNGEIWVNWTFRVNSPNIDQEKFTRRVKKYVMYWIHTNNHQGKRLVFDLKVKKMDNPSGWEHGFLERQLSHPWIDAGIIIYENNELIVQAQEIESI